MRVLINNNGVKLILLKCLERMPVIYTFEINDKVQTLIGEDFYKFLTEHGFQRPNDL